MECAESVAEARTLVDKEKIATEIAEFSREEVIERLMNFKGNFPLDFTRECLERKETDKLRHILLAAELDAK